MKLRSTTIIAALVPVLGLCSCGFAAPRLDRDVQMRATHVSGKPISVESCNGSIVIRRSDGSDVDVRVRLSGPSRERLDEARVKAVRDAEGELRLEVEWPGGKPENNEGASFEVTLPDANGVEADTSNGAIEIVGLSGKAELDTSNGSVTVKDHAGPVEVDTSNGAVKLTNVPGPIDAETSNAPIVGANIGAPATLDTSNGSITVDFAPDAAGPVKLSTSNGSVKAQFGPSFASVIAVETSNGSVKVDAPANAAQVQLNGDRDEGRVTLGGGGPASKIETSNGGVHITIKGS